MSVSVSQNSGNGNEKDSNLPKVHHSEFDCPVDVMVQELRMLDGKMSLSNALVPEQAQDVGVRNETGGGRGGEDMRPNPRASDLGYPEGTDPDTRVKDEDRKLVMWDDGRGATTYIEADEGSYVENLAILA